MTTDHAKDSSMLGDSDINLLEAYLDDALSASEVQRLDARLSEEPAVAAALDALRSERAARVAVFQSLTPDAPQADKFASAVLADVRRRQFMHRFVRGATIAASLAACVLVGITIGWAVWGHGGGTNVVKVPDKAPNGGPLVVKPLDVPLTSMNQKGPTTRQATNAAPATIDISALGLTVTEIVKDDPLALAQFPSLGSRPSIRIDAVMPNSIADKAGLKANELLISLDGAPVAGASAFGAALASRHGTIEFQVISGSGIRKATIDLP